MGKGKSYVVYEGRENGIYESWEETSQEVLGHGRNVNMKFSNPFQAEQGLERFQASNFEKLKCRQLRRITTILLGLSEK